MIRLLRVFIAIGLELGAVASAAAQTPVTIEYYHLDAIGSVRAVTNQQGQVIRRHDYLPFGEEYLAGPVTPDPLRFTGKERDAETGLDYFGARYFASRTGRFTTVDPVVPLVASLRDPQLWNRYAYVRNNPLRYTDPDGRCIWDLCIAEAAIVLGVSEAAVATLYAASVATVIVWNKREEIAQSVMDLGTATGSALRRAVDSVNHASRTDPYAYPGNYPRLDNSGKAHTKDRAAHLVDHVPDNWTGEMLEDAATTLRRSIRARNDEARRLGEDPGHRRRINEEERLLRQIEKALKDRKKDPK